MLVLGFWLAALGGGEADLTDSRAAFLRSRHIPATPLEMALRLERELARGAGILMPDPERRVRLDGGVIALDAGQAGFPPEFLAGLVPEEINGVEAWRATLCADDLSGGMLFYNAAGEPFWSVAADPAVYTPDWIAKLHSVDGAVPDFSDTDRVYQDLLARPSRRMQTPDQVFYRSAWLSTRQYFLPSHTEMTFVFLLREDLDDYRSGMAANRQGAALAGAPAHSSATLTGLAFTGIASGTNGVALSAAWPTGTVLAGGALDVFFTPTLAPPAWTNPWRVAVDPDADGVDLLIPRADMPPPPEAPAPACVTNTAPSNYDPGVTYTNTICTNAFWLADTGFFRLADLADTDGDGLTDANENWVHGTSPTNPDTDGDGLPDGWELDHGLNPLTNDALSDLDNDRVPAVYEFHYGTNPNHADSHLIPMLRVDPAAAATNTAFHASLAAAFAASAPYAVIEVADGLYSGPDNAGLWFPVHPVLLMSEDWGASRRATVTYDGNLAAFYMNAHQDNRTIVRGLNLRLGGATAYQIGFWLGDGIPDWDEVQCGTDPLAATNYCVTILGAATNIAISSGLFRAGASLTADGSGMLAETDVAPAGGFVLPHVRVSAAGALHVHLYDDLNDNGELDASDVLATQDLSITGLVTAIIFDGKLAYCDNDGDGMPDFWEARHGLSWTNAADACDNPDGDGLINLHEYWCRTDPEVADGAQYALSDAALAIDSRIAGRNPTNALPLFENYIANGTNGVFIRNADCWAADLDLTCCSPWNGETWYGKNMMAGTLISPRHVLFAAHFAHISINSTMTFVDRQNNIITRELVAKMQHWAYTNNPVPYPDITVGLLDADVPTNQISFARVLPDNYADYIRTGARLPAIRLDQEEKALIGDVRYVSSEGPRFSASCMLPVDSMRLAFFENVIKYDSGNPAFIFIDGQPILLTVWTGPLAGSGTSVTAFKGDINQLMSDLGGGYQLTEVDLTGFTPLP